MMLFFRCVWLLSLFSSLALSKPARVVARDGSPTTSADLSNPTACGDVIDYANQGYIFFDAYSVYQCFISVPFLDAVATRFIEYYNTTIQFQSTLAYLKNPPATYQQPAIDVVEQLTEIQQNVTAGHYKNQYEFEASLESIVYQMHDYHVQLVSGILSSFSFGSYYDLMSVSVDGKQLPQPYIADDVISSLTEGWTPSPIVSINGEDAVTYLTQFAALNSVGMLEPHADWNQLMYSPTQDIEGIYNTFGWLGTFYPGQYLNFTFANGSTVDTTWLAIYQNTEPTGPLSTGGDYYNYFVLGLVPASYDPDAYPSFYGNDTGSDDNTTSTSTSWYNVTTAYPEFPDVAQPDLSVTGGGILTGYYLKDISTGVLSIPSFDNHGDLVGTFSNTTAYFIAGAKSAGMTRIVIDLQQNYGGTPLLAFDTFDQFFPNVVPFAGSRRRSFQMENILGGAMTDFWSSLVPGTDDYDYYYPLLAANEWVVTDLENAATGQNFTSWQEFYGPVHANDDTFSLTERYNLSSLIFDDAAFEGWAPDGWDGNPDNLSPPYQPQDIVLLTDGTCSSACALFVEMMTHEAGVRTIVVGGSPKTGPMQAASGSRGASLYSADVLDANLAFAGLVNDTANTTLPQVRDPNMFTIYAGFNLRDQIRKDDSVPLQFQYEAANCRIFYTLANAYNMSRLWRDAAAATWDDPTLCVEGSTGYASSGNTTAAKAPPAATAPSVGYHINSATEIDSNLTYTGGLPDGLGVRSSGTPTKCSSICQTACKPIRCSDFDNTQSVSVCLPRCNPVGAPCGNGWCYADSSVESKAQVSGSSGSSGKGSTKQVGLCYPYVGTPELGCPTSGTGSIGAPP